MGRNPVMIVQRRTALLFDFSTFTKSMRECELWKKLLVTDFTQPQNKNPKLALAICDSSWSELIRQLDYKCLWYGRNFVKIDQWFPSSKRCSSCGHTVEKMPLKIRSWRCPSCDCNHDRDLNASKNILAVGLTVSVCGATVRAEQNKSVKAGAKPLKGKKQKSKS